MFGSDLAPNKSIGLFKKEQLQHLQTCEDKVVFGVRSAIFVLFAYPELPVSTSKIDAPRASRFPTAGPGGRGLWERE